MQQQYRIAFSCSKPEQAGAGRHARRSGAECSLVYNVALWCPCGFPLLCTLQEMGGFLFCVLQHQPFQAACPFASASLAFNPLQTVLSLASTASTVLPTTTTMATTAGYN
jgi:hypothetical protein